LISMTLKTRRLMMPSYVAVLPDGAEYFEDTKQGNVTLYDIGERAVRNAKITATRSNPQSVDVVIKELIIKNGEMTRSSGMQFSITPPLERMTEEEFQAEMTEILKDIPLEFSGFISHSSWEQGHSAGREEVASIAREMAGELIQPIKAYARRIKKEFEDA
jgi:hypothetical protein